MRLLLEDGTELHGECFGTDAAVTGEVVFNTAMAGYVEALTDPSYAGQILALTYPLIGNYGVTTPRTAGSLDGPYESDRIQVQGLVVQNYVDDFSHSAATRSLGSWLRGEGIPAVTGIDTRTLTRKLREMGTMKGWLIPGSATTEAGKLAAGSVEMRAEVFTRVAPREAVVYDAGPVTVMVVDVGAKDNIIRSLLNRDVSVLRVPWHAQLDAYADRVDGILIGNGPGDPSDLGPLVEKVRNLLAREDKPVFGICLGNQILALAAGASTYKLPYGHRGVNQPVQDLLTRQCFITSQNHGYAVDDESLPGDWDPWFVNINDGTNEGIRARMKPFFGVQFHPEAKPGPEDTGYLFDDFLRLIDAMKRR
jgi:carbamoyl-phosphate synthase small subunit